MRQASAPRGRRSASVGRRGKPTKKPKPKSRKMVDAAAKAFGQKRRTYQRMLRVLASDLRDRVLAGELTVAQADRLLSQKPEPEGGQ